MKNEIRDQLAALEDRLRRLREEPGRLAKVFQAAKSAAEENETDVTLGAAVAAKESVQQIEQQIEAESERQVELLRRLGDAEAGRLAGPPPASTAGRKQPES